MTQTVSSTSSAGVIPANQSFPLDFALRNVNDQAVLYIDDIGETLSLDIKNTARNSIRIGGLRWDVSARNNHFELRFRPGTLAEDAKITLAPEAQSLWKLSQAKDSSGFVSLYLLRVGDLTLDPGQIVTIRLENLVPAVSGGSRGTRVELVYSNLLNVQAKTMFAGTRLQNLVILNHQGRKQIPLHVGFADSNKVLNDGKNGNTLTLRITNTLQLDSANPERSAIALRAGGDAPTRLIFSFIAGDQGMDWALGEDDQIKAIVVETFDNIAKILLTSPASGEAGTDGAPVIGSTFLPAEVSFGVQKQISWNIRAEQQGQAFALVLTPNTADQLAAGDYIQFTFTNIVTAHPCGYSNLYVHFENIPGYWDGEFTCPIEKAPLTYVAGRVGIGTADPRAALEVIGGVQVSGALSAQSLSGIGAVPSGAIMLWPSSKPVPPGWLACDGSSHTPDLRQQSPQQLGYIQKS